MKIIVFGIFNSKDLDYSGLEDCTDFSLFSSTDPNSHHGGNLVPDWWSDKSEDQLANVPIILAPGGPFRNTITPVTASGDIYSWNLPSLENEEQAGLSIP